MLLSMILLISVLCMALAGCGGEPDPYEGTWDATSVSMGDMSMVITEIFPAGISMRLDDDGYGSLILEGEGNGIEWVNEEGVLTITDLSGTASGKLEGNELILREFGGSGVDIHFVKAG